MKPAQIPVESIKIGTRMRTEYGDLQSLADSIKEVGLIQPVVIDEQFNLIAGGRRYAAITQILKWPTIPVVLSDTEGSEVKLRIMELEENVRRLEMTWKDRCRSVAEVHRLHQLSAWKNGESWTQKATGELINASVGDVNFCVQMGEFLADPNHPVQKALSMQEAFRILITLKEDEAIKYESQFAQELQTNVQAAPSGQKLTIDSAIASADQTKQAPVEQTNSLVNAIMQGVEELKPTLPTMQIALSKYAMAGNCLDHMAAMPEQSVDLIVTDPPFGIDMENLEQSGEATMDTSRVAETHDVDENIVLLQKFFPAAFRILKDKTFLVAFYDFQYHAWIVDVAEGAGFTVCRWPLVWVKTHNCKNQAAGYNFTKATEVAIVCRKGNATLVQPQRTNYWMGSNEEDRKKFNHPFVKPEGLWRWIYQAVGTKGQIAYDPFAGVGSGIVTAAKMGFYPRASELMDIHHSRLIVEFKSLIQLWYGQTHNLQYV